MSSAGTLVEQAKKWAGYYGRYANGPEGAVITVPLRIRAAWDNADADAFAGMFTENGSFIIGDETLSTPSQIHDYVKHVFAGSGSGSRLQEEAVEIRLLEDDVALAVMEGSIVMADETEADPEHTHRSVYVMVKQQGDWRLLSLQTNPVRG